MLEQHYDQPLPFNVAPPPQPSSFTAITPINDRQQQQLSMLDQTTAMTTTTPSGTTVSAMVGSHTTSSLGHPTDTFNSTLHAVLPQQEQQQLAVPAADSLSSLPSNTLRTPNEQQQQRQQQQQQLMQQSGLSQEHCNNSSMVATAQGGLVLLDTPILQQQQTPHMLTPSAVSGSAQTTPLPSPLEQRAAAMVFNQHPFSQQQQDQDHRHPLQQQHDQMIQDMINSGSQGMAQNATGTTAAMAAQPLNEAYHPVPATPQTVMPSQPLPMGDGLHIHHHPGSLASSPAYDTTQTTCAMLIPTDNHQVGEPALTQHQQASMSEQLAAASLIPQTTPQPIIPVQQHQQQHNPPLPPVTDTTGKDADNQQQHIGKHLLQDIPFTGTSSSTTANTRKKIRRHTMSTPYPAHLYIQQQKGALLDPTIPHSAAAIHFDHHHHQHGQIAYPTLAHHHNHSMPSTPVTTEPSPTAPTVFIAMGSDGKAQQHHHRNATGSNGGIGVTSRRAPGHLSLPPPPTPQELFSKIQSAPERHQTVTQAPLSATEYEAMSRAELVARLVELEQERRTTAPSTATSSTSVSTTSSLAPTGLSIESHCASSIKEGAMVDFPLEEYGTKAKGSQKQCDQDDREVTKDDYDNEEEEKYEAGCEQQQQKSEEGPSECLWENCGKSFEDLQTMVSHISEAHVGGGKPSYSCVWKNCRRYGKAFTKRHKMYNHLRTHTGERPYLCTKPDCDKRFSRPDSLATHIKTHSNVRPYICSVQGCGRAYYHARSLNKHGKTHLVKIDDREFPPNQQHPSPPPAANTPYSGTAGPMPALEFLHSHTPSQQEQQQQQPLFRTQPQEQQHMMPTPPQPLSLVHNPLPSHHLPQQQQHPFISATSFHPHPMVQQQQTSSRVHPPHQQQHQHQQKAYTPLEHSQQQVSVVVATDAAAVSNGHNHLSGNKFS